MADIGTFDDGGVDRCTIFPFPQGYQRCIWVDWPAQVYAYARNSMRRNAWHGSVTEDKADAAGTYFRRYRQYDPQTGRFTQEDPIGLAGGLNLYGFAAGDPVNFSDPFGLCKPWPDCWFQNLANWGARKGGALGTVALNVGAGLNAASEALGTNDLGAAIGEGHAGKAAIALATLLPIGRLGKAARVLRNVDGGLTTATKALEAAERWLGEGYRQIAEGVFRSADNTRQFRMTASDLLDTKIGPHVHFEAIGPNGRTIIENAHVRIVE